MADHNAPDSDGKYYSEILSPSELFAARSRTHKIPVRGQKDFFPDNSDEQRQQLQQTLNEHWSLVSEERVERLGNLVRATWIPSEQIVALQSPAGSVQVFYQDLPLSIQDGYESFLSSHTVSLQQYQVGRCRNWSEYKELVSRQQGQGAEKLLEKIRVIKQAHLLEEASRLKGSAEWRICFNVYQPDAVADFKKSSPGKPYSRICVCSFDGPVPDLRAIKLLTFQSGDVPVVFAVVDHGDISFYTFKDFQLPTDVYP
ncbi:unnamed protein product [Lampetra planeri]